MRVPGSCLWGVGERGAACGRSTEQSRDPHLAGQGEGGGGDGSTIYGMASSGGAEKN